MLCISAAIAVMRCPSIRPSVTFVDHVKTNKHIFKIFSPSGSHTILVFPYQRGCRYSDGNPSNRGVECKGVMKKSRLTISFHVVYALHCDIKSGINTTNNVNDYNKVRSEIRFFVLELFSCLRSEVRKCK